jgi:hypothetical protein
MANCGMNPNSRIFFAFNFFIVAHKVTGRLSSVERTIMGRTHELRVCVSVCLCAHVCALCVCVRARTRALVCVYARCVLRACVCVCVFVCVFVCV